MNGLEEESMDVDAKGGDSDFDVEGGKKKTSGRNAKKPKKAAQWDVYDVDEDHDDNAAPKRAPKQKRQPRKPKELQL